MPAKRGIFGRAGHAAEADLRNRMRMLGLFVDELSRNPHFKSDVMVLKFLSIADQKDWDAIKKAVRGRMCARRARSRHCASRIPHLTSAAWKRPHYRQRALVASRRVGCGGAA